MIYFVKIRCRCDNSWFRFNCFFSSLPKNILLVLQYWQYVLFHQKSSVHQEPEFQGGDRYTDRFSMNIATFRLNPPSGWLTENRKNISNRINHLTYQGSIWEQSMAAPGLLKILSLHTYYPGHAPTSMDLTWT